MMVSLARNIPAVKAAKTRPFRRFAIGRNQSKLRSGKPIPKRVRSIPIGVMKIAIITSQKKMLKIKGLNCRVKSHRVEV